MIEVKNVSKIFGNHKVLDNISTTFETGKTNLVIGKSGSGKTVLVKSMVGLLGIDSGTVTFDGRVFSELSTQDRKLLRREIGMVFQGTALFDSLNIEDNVCFPLNMFSKKTGKEKLDRVNFCLDRVNLGQVNRMYPSELSGGMKKRVGIARAIVQNPKYLFCDEPTSGLDPQTAIVIDALIKEITEEFNITTIINTHDMNSVMEIGEKIIYLHDAQKWWEGSKDDILDSDNKELNDFIFASKFLRTLRTSKE